MDALSKLADLDGTLVGLAALAADEGHAVEHLAVFEPPPVDLDAAVAEALRDPIGSPPLGELAAGARTAAIITSDATRPVPTARLLEQVVEELTAAGVPLDGIDLVVGTGAHRPATRDELDAMLGARFAGRLRAGSHDPRANDLVSVGTLPEGSPISVDRRVAAADLRIAFGNVEPHEFAGFTGGRKAILPAVADYQVTLRNHSLERLRHPRARSGILAGNPIHGEMVAAARLARLDFVVNVVLDGRRRPLAVAAGDVEAAHEHLVAFVRSYSQQQVPTGPYDVIVTGPGDPLDINLYQSVKALVGIEPVVEAQTGEEGVSDPVVVLLSRCWDGTGSAELLDPFRGLGPPGWWRAAAAGEPVALDEVAAEGRERAHGVLAGLSREYTIEKDHSYFVARFVSLGAPVVACCPGVADEDLAALGWLPAPKPETALRVALRAVAPGGRLLCMPRSQRALMRSEPASPRPEEPAP
jgi:nickel-dependent lactate racemase